MALASIILAQPVAIGGFSQDELEGLAGDYFGRFGVRELYPARPRDINGRPQEAPAEKPGPAIDPTDPFVDEFHVGLRDTVRVRRKPVVMDLRDASGSDGREIWNQACHRYESILKEADDAVGDPDTDAIRQIHVTTRFVCNEDFLWGNDLESLGNAETVHPVHGRLSREQETTYVLLFSESGEVMREGDILGRTQNWLSINVTHSARTGDDVIPAFVPGFMGDASSLAIRFQNRELPPAEPDQANPEVDSHRLTELGLVLTGVPR